MSSRVRRIWAAVAMGFGALTVVSGFSVLFGSAEVAASAGDAVPWVLWFNALSGFVYVAAGLCLWRNGPYARPLALGLAVALAVVFAGLGLHIATGGPYEMRTVAAMTLRLGFWAATAFYLFRYNPRAEGVGP